MKLRVVKGLRSGTDSECFRVEMLVDGTWEQTPFVWSTLEQAVDELTVRAADARERRRWTVVLEHDAEKITMKP